MKVKFLTSLCGGPKDYHAGNVADILDKEALKLVDGLIAEAVNKNEYDAAKLKLQQEEHDKEEQLKKIAQITLKDELLQEKERLASRIAEIDNILGIDKLPELKAKADSLGINYNDDIEVEELAKLIEEEESNNKLTELKAKADELGVKYTKKTTAEELAKLIEEEEKK